MALQTEAVSHDSPSPTPPRAAVRGVERGIYPCPFGFALNVALPRFERLVPVAADSPVALAPIADALALVRASGGFEVQGMRLPTAEHRLVFEGVPDLDRATKRIRVLAGELLAVGRDALPPSEARLELPTALELRTPTARSLSVHLYVDGTSTRHEHLLARLAQGMLLPLRRLAEANGRSETHVVLRRRVLARCRIDLARLFTGHCDFAASDRAREAEAVRQALRWLDAAQAEPVLASAQNELVLDNVTRLAQALGNDAGRISAEGHCHASRFGTAAPLARFVLDGRSLVGTIELPLVLDPRQRRHDQEAQLANALLRDDSLEDLGLLSACLGLAAHLATLKAATSLALVGSAPERASGPPALRRSSLPPPPLLAAPARTPAPPRTALPPPPWTDNEQTRVMPRRSERAALSPPPPHGSLPPRRGSGASSPGSVPRSPRPRSAGDGRAEEGPMGSNASGTSSTLGETRRAALASPTRDRSIHSTSQGRRSVPPPRRAPLDRGRG